MPPFGPCPITADESAEEYLLGQLSTAEARAFEEHYTACATCAAMLEETRRYVLAMKRATKRLRSGKDGAGPRQ